jgi:hypothetical protein
VEFFVPAATPDNIDEVYASFAEMCHSTVPPPDRRIYSIRFIHDGTEWTATVDEQTARNTDPKTAARWPER